MYVSENLILNFFSIMTIMLLATETIQLMGRLMNLLNKPFFKKPKIDAAMNIEMRRLIKKK